MIRALYRMYLSVVAIAIFISFFKSQQYGREMRISTQETEKAKAIDKAEAVGQENIREFPRKYPRNLEQFYITWETASRANSHGGGRGAGGLSC
jgi:hypothetical protein